MLITNKKLLENYTSTKRIWQGIPSIEVTEKGRIFLTFYSGGTREEIGNFVLLIKSDDGVNYSEPIAVCYEEGYRCFDPNIWIDPLGRLWLFWARCPSDGTWAAICDDPDADELVFGEEFFVGNNIMMNKPTVLSTGEWAFPLAVWDYNIRVMSSKYDSDVTPKGSFIYTSDDEGKTFKKLGFADVKKRHFDENMILELSDGRIRMFVRTFYGIGAADSYDRGFHFGECFDTGYGGPSSRFFISRLPSGRVLLINHHNTTERNNLTALLSEDDGQTFPYKLLIDERYCSYPDATFNEEGRIHITYDRGRGTFLSSLESALKSEREILVASITEEEILNGAMKNKDSYLKRVACKLGEYDGDNKNPYNEPKYFTDDEYAAYLQNNGDKEDIISELLTAYKLNCSNIRNLDAEKLDRMVGRYQENKDMNILVEIISLVRSAKADYVLPEQSLVNEICRYIAQNCEEKHDTEKIAKEFNYSACFIQHIFKKHTGTTLGNYRNEQRIIKSKFLLRGTNKKIVDVSAECGFDDASYFAKVFKNTVGVTPKQYRSQYKSE